jgi:hypothetical protein
VTHFAHNPLMRKILFASFLIIISIFDSSKGIMWCSAVVVICIVVKIP